MSNSPFLNEDEVIVEFGELKIPIQDAALYKSGWRYVFKNDFRGKYKGRRSRNRRRKRKAQKISRLKYAQKGTEFFELTDKENK